MKILRNLALSAAVAVLAAACGGGGGSPGDTAESYTIALYADKTDLPVNINNFPEGTGVYHPFTTVLHVEAKKGSAPIPGGEDIFQCDLKGVSKGSLYYLDMDDDHVEEVDDGKGGTIKIRKPFRNFTLPANSGADSFMFHAGNEAGTAKITCSVTDPRANRLVSASVDIKVGAATGKAASIKTIATYDFLGSQGNLSNLRTASAIQAFVLDDANQPLGASANANLQVAIVSGGASSGARLLVGSQEGSVVKVSTTGGVGLFTLSSGASEGTILLELTADRADNDVTNGIQDPIVSLLPIPVSNQIATDPVVIEAPTLPDASSGVSYEYAFSATGGLAPYTWSTSGALPPGLTLSADGTLTGTPSGDGGTYNFVVRVSDGQGKTEKANVTLVVAAPPPPPEPPEPVPPAFAVGGSGCTGTTCTLPAARDSSAYSYTFWTTGGDTAATNTWSKVGAAWLAGLDIDAGTGELTWAAPSCLAGPQTVQMRVTDGTTALIQTVTVPVTQGDGSPCP